MKKRINVEVDKDLEIACRRALLDWQQEDRQDVPRKFPALVEEALRFYLLAKAPGALVPRPGRPPKSR